MSRAKRISVSVGVVVFVLCCGFEMATGREHWPFSPYPMFSDIEEPVAVTRYRLWGVPVRQERVSDGVIELTACEYISPFYDVRLNSALKKLLSQEDGHAKLRRAATDLLSRYQRRRRAAEHDGPKLASLQIVAITWVLLRDASNVDGPESVELLVEVSLPSREKR